MYFYLKYYFSALTKYKVHSPFVFEFVTDILEDDRAYYLFSAIENYRRNLSIIKEKIPHQQKSLPLYQLAKNLEVSPFYGQLLFRVVHHYKPKTILELGTSLGISTLYLATPDSTSPVTSLGDNLPLLQKTTSFFKKLGTKNITVLKGTIKANLPLALNAMEKVDFIYFNDFWGFEKSLAYWQTCLEKGNENSIFAFKNPYQSAESVKFWESIKADEKVKLSIDLYELGLLFFRSEQKEVAHYTLIEYWKKPWAVF